MSLHPQKTPWTLLATEASSPLDHLIVILFSFDYYSMSKTTQPYQILFDRNMLHFKKFLDVPITDYII